jgi:deoxycytidylate deaminase
MTCAKARVFVTLTHPDGRRWTGENRCRNPQQTCPRGQGEDYTKCRTVCDQVGHAELDALAAAGDGARSCTASLHGHTYYCMPCQHALFAAGVVALLAPKPSEYEV